MSDRLLVLTEQQGAIVDELVQSGRFVDANDVLTEALKLVQASGERDAAELAELRAALQVGLDDIDAGRVLEFENVDALCDHLGAVFDRGTEGGPR